LNSLLNSNYWAVNDTSLYTINSNQLISIGKNEGGFKVDVHGSINFESGGLYSNAYPLTCITCNLLKIVNNDFLFPIGVGVGIGLPDGVLPLLPLEEIQY
jgi:hypothetical protein